MAILTVSEFADRASETMAVISREFMKQRTSEFYNLKITMPQLAILELLNRSIESNMSDMARYMDVTTAAMTGVVDRLVRDGYVSRTHDKEDRRVIKIKLTAKGSSALKSILERKRQLMERIFGALSQEERENYLKILTRIREGLSR